MRRPGYVLTTVLLVVLTATGASAQFSGLAQQPVDADVVVMNADVEGDGDAQWAIAYRVRLDDDNDTQAFEDVQADIEANPGSYTDQFGDRMSGTARAAENATGREMAIENVTVESSQESIGQTYGVVTYRFQWTNFAATEGDRIEMGDSLSGLFLDSHTSLTLRWPSAYQADTVRPAPDEQTDRSATWRGQQSFGSDEPRVVATSGGGLSSTLLGVGVVAVLAIAGAIYAVRRRLIFGGDGTDADASDAAGASPTEDAPTGGDGPPAELLSNEEQLLKLLEDNGGRIKQQRVADELEWTDAKTSQVVGGLREDDELETFRIGRENVVTLPETDVTGDPVDDPSENS